MTAWKKMNIDDLHELFKKRLPQGHLILDVRDEDEFAEGHIEGAVNIPHERVAQAADQLRKFQQIYVHCGGGGRAGKAVASLEAQGLTNLVHICDSGMRQWVSAGYPVVK